MGLVFSFGASLGVTAVVFPLIALDVGIRAGVIGLLAALGAGTQMASRLALPGLLGRYSDRSIMIGAYLAIGASALIVIVSATAGSLIVANALQGAARGLFHTSSQTHAVRSPGIPTRRLALTQSVSQLGRLVGPALAGTLALISLVLGLWAVVLFTATAVVLGLTLELLPPYDRVPHSERTPIWRRPGIGIPAWGGVVGGTWSGVAESYVPVILAGRGFFDGAIGWLVSISDAAGFFTTASFAKWGGVRVARLIPIAAVALTISLAALPLVTGLAALVVVLIIAGSSGGVGSVLGTGAATETIEAREQGAAIALVGLYRATARLVAPAAISAGLLVFSLPVAIAGIAAALLAPRFWLRTGARPTEVSGDQEV